MYVMYVHREVIHVCLSFLQICCLPIKGVSTWILLRLFVHLFVSLPTKGVSTWMLLRLFVHLFVCLTIKGVSTWILLRLLVTLFVCLPTKGVSTWYLIQKNVIICPMYAFFLFGSLNFQRTFFSRDTRSIFEMQSASFFAGRETCPDLATL